MRLTQPTSMLSTNEALICSSQGEIVPVAITEASQHFVHWIEQDERLAKVVERVKDVLEI